MLGPLYTGYFQLESTNIVPARIMQLGHRDTDNLDTEIWTTWTQRYRQLGHSDTENWDTEIQTSWKQRFRQLGHRDPGN